MKISKNYKKALAFAMTGLALSSLSAKPKKGGTLNPDALITGLSGVERKATKNREGVYYSLFVRSFADGNGDGIGDFKGLTKKLDYLNDGDDTTTDDLGVTGLWLLPVFASGSYHGYDVDDYYSINPEYGTMEEFETFVKEARKRGISVILDMTCNHSSLYNKWFKESRNPSSPYRSWYRWISDEDTNEPSLGYTGPYNIKQKSLGGALWNMDMLNKGTDKNGKDLCYYYAGVFGSGMPDFNMDTQAVRDEFKKIFKFWLDKGVTGFRFDAAGHIYNSTEVKPGSETLSKAQGFWKEMNEAVWSVYPEAWNVAEVWEPTATRAKYMAGMQSNFHFDMGTFIAQIINNQEVNDKKGIVETDPASFNGFARAMEGEYAMYKKNNPDYIDAPFLSNHDQPRSSSMLRNNVAKMKMAANMYILAEGIPFIYYGEEICMKSGTKDETKRTPLLWNVAGKDKLQTSWTDNPMYQGADVYNRKTLSIAEQAKDPTSLLVHYKRLNRIKTAHPALFKGRLKAVPCNSGVIESYLMECPEEKAFVVHNVSSAQTVTVEIPEGCLFPMVFTSNEGSTLSGSTLTIPPLTSVVLAK